ncbi:protein of unknown function [Moritella yayanosii]|uniref:Uncharacterized protein n=1 Tax=Moritella yayanosii TaxID=69539 RepID=A0A330LRF8_9GAMM|nr:protein of unknown function [Moritella yayanosii]
MWWGFTRLRCVFRQISGYVQISKGFLIVGVMLLQCDVRHSLTCLAGVGSVWWLLAVVDLDQ